MSCKRPHGLIKPMRLVSSGFSSDELKQCIKKISDTHSDLPKSAYDSFDDVGSCVSSPYNTKSEEEE